MTTPTFPSYAKLLFSGFSVKRESAVLRSDMESGPARQTKVRSTVMITRSVKIYLPTLANYQSFEAWYSSDINEGASWFNFTDPVSGTSKLARFVNGGYTATPLMGGMAAWTVEAKIETWA
jgi:hypothetical protein